MARWRVEIANPDIHWNTVPDDSRSEQLMVPAHPRFSPLSCVVGRRAYLCLQAMNSSEPFESKRLEIAQFLVQLSTVQGRPPASLFQLDMQVTINAHLEFWSREVKGWGGAPRNGGERVSFGGEWVKRGALVN